MRMKMRLICMALALGCLVASGCQPNTKESSSNSGPEKSSLATPARNTNDSTVPMNTSTANSNTATMQDNFWASAAQGGMAEMEMSKLAQTKAQNAEVKRFAQMMIADHTKASSELKSLATKQNVALPTTLSSNDQSTLEELRGLSGAEFDRAYVEAMVDAHETDVALFQGQAEDDDAAMGEAKAFAAKTLPTLQKHLDMIRGIQEKLGA